jgi:ribokinase
VSVVVFGSANMDLSVQVDRVPAPGETLTGSAYGIGLGGKGLNQAVAAARFGARTAFVGRVGNDPYGSALLAGLAEVGVDTGGAALDEQHPSGVALITVGPDGENRIIVVGGANGAVGAQDVARLGTRLQARDVLLVQLELPLPAVVAAVETAAAAGARVILDPAPVPAVGLPASFYASHVILTPNESEGAALVGYPLRDSPAVERAARTLLGRGVDAVVLKLGERGVCWAHGDEVGWQPASSVRVRDTVGAGDAVNGVLASALDDCASLREAVRLATAAGGIAVTRPGAYDAMPTREQVLGQLSVSSG